MMNIVPARSLALLFLLLLPDSPARAQIPKPGPPPSPAQVRKAAEDAANGTRKAADDAANALKNGADRSANTVKNTVPSPGQLMLSVTQEEKDLLEAIHTLHLESLFSCLRQNGKASGITLQDVAKQAAANPVNFAGQTTERMFTMVAGDLEALVTADVQRLRDAGAALKPEGVVDLAWANLELLGSRRKEIGCFVDFIRPHQAEVKAAAVKLARRAAEQSRQFYETTGRTLLAKALAQGFFKAAELGAGPKGPFVAKGIVAKHLLDPPHLGALAGKVDGLANALDAQPYSAGAVQTALADLHASIQQQCPPNADLAIDLVQGLGHEYIHNDEAPGGGSVIDQYVAAMGSDTISLEEVLVDDVCGLVNGLDSISEAIMYCGKLAVEHVEKPLLKAAAVKMCDEMLDAYVELARMAARDPSATAALSDLRRRAGPLGEEMSKVNAETLRQLCDRYVRDMVDNLGAYNRSVEKLAQHAARLGPIPTGARR